MKKTLIALAAVAAATAASAQTAPTVYGRMDLGYSSVKSTATTGVVTKTTSLAGAESGRTTSRFGVTGGEDIGGGLKASYVYEVGAAAETGFGAARLANIAVSGGFGTAVIGTFYNIFDDIGTSPAAIGSHTTNFVLTGGRSSNAVAYVAPTMNGLTLSAGGLNEKKTVSNASSTNTEMSGFVLGAKYAAGPLNVWAGYSNADVDNIPSLYYFAEKAMNTASFTATDANQTEMAIKVTYDLGVAVPFLILADNEVDNGATTYDGSGNEIGATFPMGAFTPFVSYATAKYKTNDAADGKYSGNTLGTTYTLSKRTYVHGSLTNQKLKEANGTQAKVKTIKAGLVHQF